MYKRNFKYLDRLTRLRNYYSKKSKDVLSYDDFLDYLYTVHELQGKYGVSLMATRFSYLLTLPEFGKLTTSELASYFIKADNEKLLRYRLTRIDSFNKASTLSPGETPTKDVSTDLDDATTEYVQLNAAGMDKVIVRRKDSTRKTKEYRFSRAAITISLIVLLFNVLEFWIKYLK